MSSEKTPLILTNPQDQLVVGDRVVSFEEIITVQFNAWRRALIQRCGDYHEAMNRFNANPNQRIPVGQGQEMNIIDVVRLRKTALIEARSEVETLALMLSEHENISQMWSDENIPDPDESKLEPIKSPLQVKRKK